ncbi:hypothetical protein RHOSPDRAFT_33227 [Rhodotorula sp. JG-1b]|nr:hypothetical protein RHOSPDRAFT_33227 [Rhodotorula sp. JG-1b]
MLYRLPLELDLTILELAAPPLAIDHLHDRVAFFNKIALARLKQRFEAGFGRDPYLATREEAALAFKNRDAKRSFISQALDTLWIRLPYVELNIKNLPRDAPADVGPDEDDLAEVQQAVELIIDAPQCTFKYVRSTEMPKEALANALASLKL